MSERPDEYNFINFPLSKSLTENVDNIRNILDSSSDLLVSYIEVGGIRTSVVCFEGMISGYDVQQMVIKPLMDVSESFDSPQRLLNFVREQMILSVDTSEAEDYGKIMRMVMSGFVILLIDGVNTAVCFGVQGYSVRGIDEPSSEGNIRGSHEGFVETVRTNMSLLRRRIKSPCLRFRLFPVTKRSNVDVIVCYMDDRVPKALVKDVIRRLKGMELESILGSGYVQPFLENSGGSLFSGVSVTERPDVMCAKLLEGRVGVLIEGTPFALVLPSLFVENFQTLDDYNFRPFFAVFLRYIRYIAFFAAVFLPGIYLACALFHPRMFESRLLLNLCAAEESAPLNLLWEAVITLVFYEIIREAGVRLPKAVGGAVSIVGGLIIGDAAVSAGIISNPMLLVCAIAVTASFVLPPLDQQITILRFAAVLAGGLCGLFGIGIVAFLLLSNICSAESYGVPVMSPISPFSSNAMGDVAVRLGFRKLAVRDFTVEKLRGADIEKACEASDTGGKEQSDEQ
ncbi:MAG: spore germination protein [Huintestinicola sp.]